MSDYTPSEEELLAPCRKWFQRYLQERNRRSKCEILENTDRRQLRYVLNEAGLSGEFPEASAWEVKVDVVGFIRRRSIASLAFVELKVVPISLRDVGQLLGYCRVCRPTEAFLLSSQGLSSQLLRLLTSYGRTDVLEFGRETIRVGSWDYERGTPDWSSIIPPGALPQLT